MDDNQDKNNPDILIEILTSSGFQIISLQTVVDALAKMEEYLKEQAGIDQAQLDFYLKKIEELLGREEALNLELDEILSWIRVFQSV
jgi:hypothetical protein